MTGKTPTAIVHPQLPHSQTAQLQTPPLQFGQWQSTQPQPDELFTEATPDPAQANAQANPIDNVAKTAETEKRVMIFSQTNGKRVETKNREATRSIHFNHLQRNASREGPQSGNGPDVSEAGLTFEGI